MVIAGRWLTAFFFLVAALPKLFHLSAFAEAVGAYGMLPDLLVAPVAFVLPLFEILLAIGLFFKKRLAIYGTSLLLVLFIGVLWYAVYLGLDIDCGCFGPGDPELTAFQGLRTALVRDIVLLLFMVNCVLIKMFKC